MPEKILINLLSGQRLPSFIAIMHELPERVLALATRDFKGDGARFKTATGTPHEEYPFDPYALTGDLDGFRKLLGGLPEDAEVVINFTGGTKIMAVAAVLAALAEAQTRSFRLIYLDTGRAAFESLDIGPNRQIAAPVMIPVDLRIPFEAYLLLRGEKLLSAVRETTQPMRGRSPITEILLKEECDGFFWKQKELFGKKETKPSGSVAFTSRSRKSKKTIGSGELEWDACGALFTTPTGKAFTLEGPKCADFFAGGWLEECCFRKLLDAGRFDEVLLNATLELRNETKERMQMKQALKNEIDLIVCKGLRAAIIECKAGNVTQDHIYKLAALRDHLLGTFGVAAIVSRVPINPAIREKAADLEIEIIMGDRIARLPSTIDKLLEKK